MPSPETGVRYTPRQKLQVALGVFLITVLAGAPDAQQADPVDSQAALIEKCKDEYPMPPRGLTMDDYLGIQRWGGEVHRELPYEREIPLFQRLITRIRGNQLRAYETSSERTRRIETHVNRFAAGIVGRANSGDPTYKFYQGGGGAFLDGQFLTGPDGLEPAADDYEGFGWLWRNVEDDDGKLIKQEIVDNIYRYSDGTYYEHPHPWTLGVYDKNAQSTFDAPEGLGLVECASVPGNGATQGWRVSHYDFNHLGEPGYETVQLEPWVYGNTTIADVQLADRRAFHFLDNRYNPDTSQ